MRYRQGKFIPSYPKKYVGDISNIIYRSGLELKFFYRCDINSNILEWGAEEIVIPYLSEYDQKVHRYFTDLYLKVKTRKNGIQQFIVEIKPKKFTRIPRIPKSGKTKGYLLEVKNYIINMCKWKYAKKYAEKNGMKFIIFTEDDLK